MPAEHLRRDENGKVGLYQGYYCLRCGGNGVNMYGSGHGEGKCEPQPKLVKELVELNK